jgi:hypothetical protein
MSSIKLKDLIFGTEEIRKIADLLNGIIVDFNPEEFYNKIVYDSYSQLELMERKEKITSALSFYLLDFPHSIDQIVEISNFIRDKLGDKEHFQFIFIIYYVERFGKDYINEVLEIIPEITKLFSAEFCIRQFIEIDPILVYNKMLEFAKNPSGNPHPLGLGRPSDFNQLSNSQPE